MSISTGNYTTSNGCSQEQSQAIDTIWHYVYSTGADHDTVEAKRAYIRNEQYGQTEEVEVSVENKNIFGKTQTKTMRTVEVTNEDLENIVNYNRGNEYLERQVEIFREFRQAREASNTTTFGGQVDFDRWLEASDPTIYCRA
ncbi:hypothetical protein L486_01802 [Kwoniella mangroviensis CBS 10435]|uniref:Uncharacterized protein n=1 Tax=Kwoniella mangroviensis CBS 10435 TaxID=1331196 RepID=A0A1B9J2Z3_9TREE|nr:hypothetical protein L486_01802 [Kwoniella mangroviensis CBS 10435]